MRRLLILTVGLYFIQVRTAPLWGADEVGVFESCSWTLCQITQLHVDEEGRLQIKRDEWETASKSPLEGALKRASRSPLQQNDTQTPIEILFERMKLEAEGQASGSRSRSSDNGREITWRGKRAAGELKVNDRELHISMREFDGNRRRITVLENGEELQVFFFSPYGEIVQLSQTKNWTRFSSTLGGAPKLLTGPTFADIVQRNRDYFLTLSEWPEFLAELPIAEALDANLPEQSTAHEVKSAAFPEADFLDEKLLPMYSVFVRFRIADGKLQFNRFPGSPKVLDAEIVTLRQEFQEAMERSQRRMQDLGAPQVQLNQVESQFGAWKNAKVDKRTYSPFLSTFLQIQSTAGGGSTSSMLNGDAFRYDFSSSSLRSSISGDNLSFNFEIIDDLVSLDTSDDQRSVALIIASRQSVLIVAQKNDGACSLTCLSGDNCNIWIAPSWVTLVHEHEVEFRERIVPILHLYHISGLDPFHPDSVATLLERLKGAVPQTSTLDESMVDADSWVLPLLNDKEFLQILAQKVSGDDRSLVNARIETISRK